MEYPDLGKHCSEDLCRRLDFLPVKCDACEKTFCSNHMSYSKHNCPSAYKKNIQVPVCPLCNKPVPGSRGTSPDVVIGNHIDNDCNSDQARGKKRVFSNKCSFQGCKIKEIVPVICHECCLNYCFKHRHVADHGCGDMKKPGKAAAVTRRKQNDVLHLYDNGSNVSAIQGSLSEGEALTRALQLSMEDAVSSTNVRKQQLSCLVS